LSKEIHIISFDVPYPADYGGVIDVFYKIKALHEMGVKIHLHCFTKGRIEQPELEKYCSSVHYYSRGTGHKGISFQWPYIVASRINESLNTRLLQDDFPILIEGIHCSYPVFDPRFEGRKIVVRLHNFEHEYYDSLYKSSSHLLKKIYYQFEKRLLLKYEQKLAKMATILALSKTDAATYRTKLGAKNIHYVPVFSPFNKVNSQTGIGSYCLYHGNLGVAENEKAAEWLLKEVFNDIKIPFVVAGKNPSSSLESLAHKQTHTCLVSNPGETEMQDLIQKAQLCIIPSFNKTGIKLKLINTLFQSRHCITNAAGVEGSGLESACHLGSNAAAMKSLVMQLYYQPFEEEEIKLRQHLLEAEFNPKQLAQQVIRWL
jgi:hypothetical protein